MEPFIARANIDHFLDLLRDDDLPAERISAINQLLIAEENKLSRDLEQLDFAESRAALYRSRLDGLLRWRDGFADGSSERSRADGVVAKFEVTLEIVDRFCLQLRRQVNRRSL